MELAVRQFARKILLIHLLLLAALLTGVVYSTQSIESAAREQALRQAERRQAMLANQTARGIEGFYQSILNDMDLLPHADDPEAERQVLPGLLGRVMPRSPLATRGVPVGLLLSRQLQDRVSHLFVLDRDTMELVGLTRAELMPETKVKANRSDEVIVERYRAWLTNVKRQSVSRFEIIDGEGINLVCLPFGPKRSSLVVAAVPVKKIEEKFVNELNRDAGTGAFLVDGQLTTMAASRSALVGTNLEQLNDPQVKQGIRDLREEGYQGTRLLNEPFKLGDEVFAPAMVTAEPIHVVPEKQWFLLVASPLSEVDGVVRKLFRQVLIGAILVVVCATGILVSTAIQMIRSRMKLERVRHEVLRKELERARQIQQAWLPREQPSNSAIDVAAVNFPAQHISGDFYNWFDLPDGRVAIVIGDVTGHGMSAAFLMATTQLLVRNTLPRCTEPGRCMKEVNRQLCVQMFNGQFVTMMIVVVNPRGGPIELATAGHPAPLLVEGDTITKLDIEPQLVLGVDSHASYATQRIAMPVGATLLLYTDGVTDVQAPNDSRLGNEGLLKSMPARSANAQAALDSLVSAVNAFRGPREIGDDLTLVVLHLNAPAKSPARKTEQAAAVS
jgi:serine phosphatase RsbU (regulator of sigma subunit)